MIRKIISDKAITDELNAEYERIVSELEKTMMQAGKMCLEDISVSKGYQDQTGNLSASIGFTVATDGQIKYISDFDGSEGGRLGYELAKKKATESKGITLCVVAGEKYAVYVEAKGFNVISSSKLMAENIVPTLLNQLK